MPSGCPRFVFACFKRVERWGDKLTGAAGPFFVAIAALLFVIGTLCFRRFLFSFLSDFQPTNIFQLMSFSPLFHGRGSPLYHVSSSFSTCSSTTTLPAQYLPASPVIPHNARATASSGQRNGKLPADH
jgi:hypothetical protein